MFGYFFFYNKEGHFATVLKLLQKKNKLHENWNKNVLASLYTLCTQICVAYHHFSTCSLITPLIICTCLSQEEEMKSTARKT